MPGYGRHFSPSRYEPRSHSRTKRAWFCLVPSKLDPRSAQCSAAAEPWGIRDDQPQPSTVIPGISRRWTRLANVATQCAPAYCPRTAPQRCWSPGTRLCWRQRTVTSNTNSAQQCPKEESASSITVFLAQSPIVAPWHFDVLRRHNARSGQWALKARPRRGPNRRTAASKAGCIRHTLRLRARRTDAARLQPPTVERHRAQSHSRTKRAWFCLVPSKLNPRSAQCSATARLWTIPDIQPQPTTVIPGSTRRGARPASVAAPYASAHCLPIGQQQRRSPSIGLGWRPRRPAANTNYAQQCPQGESAAATTLFPAQPVVVAPRQPSASLRHNARGGQWAHKARPRRCQHEFTPTVRRAHRGIYRETAVHKTGFAPHTLPLRAWVSDAARSQPPALERHRAQSHSRTKRAWFCLVPSRLDPRLARCSTTAGHCVAPVDQPRLSNVILGKPRRWTRPTSVATQYLRAHCPPTSCKQRRSPSAGLCWRPRRPAANTNYAQHCPKEEIASPTTVLQAQPIIVASWHPDTSQRHNARGGHWARAAKPHRCQHETAPTVCRAHCGINRVTAAHKTGLALYTLSLRARIIDAARLQPPALERHRAQSHSRTKRAWFCLVPSKRNPRLARCSTTAGPWGIRDAQPQPSSAIPGSTRRWMRPASVAIQRLRARCPHPTCQRRWLPKVELCWRTYVTASNVDYAQQCPKGESASITTMFGAQPIIVAPRHPSAPHRHNARGGYWAHKGKPRRCRHEATPSVCCAHRGLNKEIAGHKTGCEPHTLPLRARETDAALPQPPTLGRHRAQRHSRTKKASYARCNPGQFPGQAVLSYHCPGLATTTVSFRRPRQINVAQRRRTLLETRSTTLAQHGIWTPCNSVRTLHSLVIPKPWPGTPWRNAAVARRRPRTSAARPMVPTIALAQHGIWTRCSTVRTLHSLAIPKPWPGTPRRNAAARRRPRSFTGRPMVLTIVGAPSQQRTRQAVDSVSPRPQPWSLPREAAVVPPRRSAVLCPVSRTGNCYPVPVIRCSPETLTKAPRRAACRVISAVCAVPRARHSARMTLDWRFEPSTAQSTTARLAPPYAVEVA